MRSHGYIPDQSASQPSSLHSPLFPLAVPPKPFPLLRVTQNPKPNPSLTSAAMDAPQDHQRPGILALFLGKIPQVGKREPEIQTLFISVFVRKQGEEDFRGMDNAPLSQLSPVAGMPQDFLKDHQGISARYCCDQGGSCTLHQTDREKQDNKELMLVSVIVLQELCLFSAGPA